MAGWTDEAACVGHAELFRSSFGCGGPDQRERTTKVCEQIVARCQAICRVCPVRSACLAEALAREERFGVWGGLAPVDRRRLSRTLRGAA